jgi:hypothetical protein
MKQQRVPIALVSSAFLALIFLAIIAPASGCKQPDSDKNALASDELCITDSIRALRILPNLPDCNAEDASCRDACFAGDAAFCLSRAYALEKVSSMKNEAVLLFRRSCDLGAAIGCTNYAARIWAEPHTNIQLICARRIFEKACTEKEPFACGMVGRLMLEDPMAPNQSSEGRRYLEAACDEFDGFPCRVLAKHLESGTLGGYDPKLIRTLLKRACAGGDRETVAVSQQLRPKPFIELR